MNIKHTFTLSLLTLCISQQLYAETAKNVVELGTTVVKGSVKTGTALAQKISEMPAVTQIIDEDEIAMQTTGNRSVADVLAQLVPSIGSSSGSTSNFGTTMHGRTVQYLLNGVPLTGSRDLSRQLNSIDPTQLERIEVLSGATSIYGSGATGGLINLVTKSVADTGWHGQTRVGLNMNDEFEGDSLGYNMGQTVTYGSEDDTLTARLDVDYEAKGGKFNSKGQRIGPEVNQTDQQDTDTISVNANLGWQMTDSQNINLAVTHYNNKQDTDYGPDYGKGFSVLLAGATPSYKAIDGIKLDEQPFTKKNSVNLNYHNSDFLRSKLNLTGYYRDESARYYPSAIPIKFTDAAKAVIGSLPAENQQQIAKSAIAVLQSTADIDVMGARAAMQTEIKLADKPTLLSYGVDYEKEHVEQYYEGNDLKTFFASNGLNVKRDGKRYTGGPDTDIDKLGVFVNADIDLTQQWHVSAGIRHQNIKADTDAFSPRSEALSEGFLNGLNIPYKAAQVAAGHTDHSKTLFNLGASYKVTPKSQIFANFSQGFSILDVQRALRDVPATYQINSGNIEPVTVNSYELGWSGKYDDTTARLSGFYNTSDKTFQFTSDSAIEVFDTDERIYGAEATVNHDINNEWSLGSTLAYTRGQYKNDASDWKALGPVRITPLKATAYAQYNFPKGSSVRLQGLAIDGTDKAAKEHADQPKLNILPVTGYFVADLLGQVKLPNGRIDYGIYNIGNTDYKTVYHQTTYGAMNRLDAAGTTYAISYAWDY